MGNPDRTRPPVGEEERAHARLEGQREDRHEGVAEAAWRASVRSSPSASARRPAPKLVTLLEPPASGVRHAEIVHSAVDWHVGKVTLRRIAITILLGTFGAFPTKSIQAQLPPVDGRYVADSISHNDSFFIRVVDGEPSENCTFLHFQRAPGTGWGRWALHSYVFAKGSDGLSFIPSVGIYRIRSSTVAFKSTVARSIAARGDTIELSGTGSGEMYFSRWIRVGDPQPDAYMVALRGLLLAPFGCTR